MILLIIAIVLPILDILLTYCALKLIIWLWVAIANLGEDSVNMTDLSFLRGAGQVMDINPTVTIPYRSDEEAITSDWYMIGQDFPTLEVKPDVPREMLFPKVKNK